MRRWPSSSRCGQSSSRPRSGSWQGGGGALLGACTRAAVPAPRARHPAAATCGPLFSSRQAGSTQLYPCP